MAALPGAAVLVVQHSRSRHGAAARTGPVPCDIAFTPEALSVLRRNRTSFRVIADNREPRVGLPAVAERNDTDLIVVDDTLFGRSPVSVDLALAQFLTKVSVPVLVVPRQTRHRGPEMRRLLVVGDQPSTTERALEAAGDLALAFDSWVTVVYVWRLLGDNGAQHQAGDTDLVSGRAIVHASLDSLCQPLRRRGVPVHLCWCGGVRQVPPSGMSALSSTHTWSSRPPASIPTALAPSPGPPNL